LRPGREATTPAGAAAEAVMRIFDHYGPLDVRESSPKR
jgi:hypothetical protein